jgi:hypothetical protein
VLPVRLGVVTAIAALCLWGLFSLLDSLQEPGLLRSSKAVVIKGCDTMETEQALRECPELFCEKALIEAKRVALSAKFQVTVNRKEEGVTLIAGQVGSATQPSSYFACEVRVNKVEDARLIERSEFDELNE